MSMLNLRVMTELDNNVYWMQWRTAFTGAARPLFHVSSRSNLPPKLTFSFHCAYSLWDHNRAVTTTGGDDQNHIHF